MGKRHDDAEARARKRRQLALRLGETTGRERGSLRVEHELLAARKRVESRTFDTPLATMFRQHLADVVTAPDEVDLQYAPDLDVAGLCGRIHDGLVHRVQSPLRVGRERADRLDLVAEQLDAKRIPSGRSVHVEDAAAHRDLPPLLYAVDTLVPCLDELLGQRVEADGRAGRRSS